MAGEDLSHSINHIKQESDSFFRVESICHWISLSLCINLAVLAPVSISLSVFVFYYMYLSGLVPCISTQRALFISLPEYLMEIFRLLSTFDLWCLSPPLSWWWCRDPLCLHTVGLEHLIEDQFWPRSHSEARWEAWVRVRNHLASHYYTRLSPPACHYLLYRLKYKEAQRHSIKVNSCPESASSDIYQNHQYLRCIACISKPIVQTTSSRKYTKLY